MSLLCKATALTPVLALLALAGCGSSSSSSSTESAPPAATTPTTSSSTASSTPAPASGAGASLSIAANHEGQLKFDQSSLTAKAGTVKIEFTNMASIAHNVTIESSSGATLGATPSFQGGAKTLSLKLKAGTYKFYCSIPGHRQAGMEGTLTVS